MGSHDAAGQRAKVRNGSCVTSNAGPHGGCVTVREMKEGPSGSAILVALHATQRT
jgi:hypothetical protein